MVFAIHVLVQMVFFCNFVTKLKVYDTEGSNCGGFESFRR